MPHATEPLEPIAIIGLACRFPGGANSPEELWQMLVDGRSGWSEVPPDRYTWRSFHHPHPDAEAGHNQKGGGYINKDLAAFDAAFFNIPAAEAHGLDPQQRIQLETAYEALESAGLPLDSVRGSKTSVHVATVSRDYDRNAYRDPQDLSKYQLTGCGEAITSGRVSYTFDLRGQCFSLDTGCSGSLVGLHLAVQGLRSRETDMALVGGTNLLLSPDMTMAMSKLHMLNDDGKCYAFDNRGKGYARSEGVSTIVLKRLSDAIKDGDPIRAIVRNTGMNQDGKTNGIMLPNSLAQEDLMRSIHTDAGLDPGVTAYVEAHGTGTQAGDNAEITSISKVFCKGVDRQHPLLIGSIKANFGHCESASGLAGLIKTVLALEKGIIPATPDLREVKEGLDLEGRNIRVPRVLEQWPELPVRRAAINSFGYGGTNVATILESYESKAPSIDVASNQINGINDNTRGHGNTHTNGDIHVQGAQINIHVNGDHPNGNSTAYEDSPKHESGDILFVVSAKSSKSLAGNLQNLKTWVTNQTDASDASLRHLAYTLAARRSSFTFRTSFLASSAEQFLTGASSAMTKQPEKVVTKPALTFVFTGQGAQWFAMGRELLHLPVFAKSLRASEEMLRDLGITWSLYEELSREQDASRINESEISQPATTALQIALVDLLYSFAVRPHAVVGHSSGEIAAAYAIGALSHTDAMQASFHRSKVSSLVRCVISAAGGMLVTTLSESEAYDHINRLGKDRLSLACINSPSSTTISGDKDALEELKTILEDQSIMAKMLAVDVAYHSHHMRAVADQYLHALNGLETSQPCDDITFFSSITGERKISGFDAEYWVQNLVSTVRFPDALIASCRSTATAGSKAPSRIFVEVGPHSALAGPVKQTLTGGAAKFDHKYVSALVRGKNALTTMVTLAGKLFEFGVEIDIDAVNSMSENSRSKSRSMIKDLPPYAWDYSNRYWHESRLSKEYRFRKYPYHDLLGLRLIGSTPLEPIWRNLLSVDAQPWLSEHVIDGFAILPGSSFLTMAMEAARQLNDQQGAPGIKRFHLRKVNYFKPIMIPESPGKVEVMISLSASSTGAGNGSSAWEKFQITSSTDTETWMLNCQGQIRVEYNTVANEVDEDREQLQTLDDLRKHLSQTDAACTKSIEHDALYGEMRQYGIDYGSNFATIKKLRIGECQALGTVVIPDVAQCMPSGYQQPHTIHPATFDALMHIVLPLYFRHCTEGTAMLTSIEEVTVSADMTTIPGNQLDVCAALSPKGPRSGSVDVTAFHNNEPVVTLRGQKFQGIAANMLSAEAVYVSRPLHNVRLPLKMTVATAGVMSSLCFVEDESAKNPLRPDEVEIKALAFPLDSDDVDVLLGRSSEATLIGQCAGIVIAVGSDLTHSFRVGERVCAWNTHVAFSTCSRVKGSFVQRIPETWSLKLAAALPQNLSLAYHALHNCAQLSSGQTVLIHRAGGALGHALALVANFLGLVALATVQTRAEKEALESCQGTRPAKAFYAEDVSLVKALLRSTEGAGLDAVVNTSSSPLGIELIESVKAFGTIVDLHQHSASLTSGHVAVRYMSFDAAQLLRHIPSTASSAFKGVLSVVPRDGSGNLVPIIEVPISDAVSALKAIQSGKTVGKTVLLADEEMLVNVKEAVSAPMTSLTHVDRILQMVRELPVAEEQKEALMALLKDSSAPGTGASSPLADSGYASPISSGKSMSPERRLAAARCLEEARSIILAEQIKKISSLVSVDSEQLDPHVPLADLGLDSLIAIEFKNWLGRSLGADLRVHDILDAEGLEPLTDLIVHSSKFVRGDLPETAGEMPPPRPDDKAPTLPIGGRQTSKLQENGTPSTNGQTNGTSANTELGGVIAIAPSQPSKRPYRFVPNKLPKFPLPPLDTILDAYINAVKAFATPEEFANTVRLASAFKKPNGKGFTLYNRAKAFYDDPTCDNWLDQLYLTRNYLDRRGPLVPSENFWFSHPISERAHSQAERAALLAFTANEFRLKLEAGEVKPVVLNERELTTAFYSHIFNAVRVPGVKSDTLATYPGTDHCVVLWRGNAFKLDLFVAGRPASLEDLHSAFEGILGRNVEREGVPFFTSASRPSWAEARTALQQLSPGNAASIAAIESSAFVVALDEASPLTAPERARQFHFGGAKDAGNRWNDKSIQFVVCTNGVSALLGEHSKLDALTLNELMDHQIAAIQAYTPLLSLNRKTPLTPAPLPLKATPDLSTQILKIESTLRTTTADGSHAYFLFTDYGSSFLRGYKMPPNSVFQMIVQLAALEVFGSSPPCWETVNQAHYHLGRVDIIQVVTPAVSSFLAACQDASVSMAERRGLMLEAIRSHTSTLSRASRNQGWERSLSAFSQLSSFPEEVPELYKDEVYKRVRPRLLMSNCFRTGMMEKGCLWREAGAVWCHYEVQKGSVYFSVVALEKGRADAFCAAVEGAAKTVRDIVEAV